MDNSFSGKPERSRETFAHCGVYDTSFTKLQWQLKQQESITNTDELSKAERWLLEFVQSGSLPIEKSFSEVVPNSKILVLLAFDSLIGPNDLVYATSLTNRWSLQLLTWNILFCSVVVTFQCVYTCNTHRTKVKLSCWVSEGFDPTKVCHCNT